MRPQHDTRRLITSDPAFARRLLVMMAMVKR